MIKTTVDHFACFDNSEMFSSDPRYHDENDMNKAKEKQERNDKSYLVLLQKVFEKKKLKLWLSLIKLKVIYIDIVFNKRHNEHTY